MASKKELIEKYGISGASDNLQESGSTQGSTQGRKYLIEKYGIVTEEDEQKRYRDLMSKYGMLSIDEDTEGYINYYNKAYTDFYNKWASGIDSVGWADSVGVSDRITADWQKLQERGAVINDFLSTNRDYLNPDFYDAVTKNMGSMEQGYQNILDAYKNVTDYYSQWATEDDYNAFLTQQEESEKKRTFDLEKGRRRIKNLEEQYEAYKLFTRTLPDDHEDLVYMRNTYGSLDDMANRIEAEKKYLEEAEQYQTGMRYYGYQDKYGKMSYRDLLDAADALPDGEEKDWINYYAPSVMKKSDYEDEIAAADARYAEIVKFFEEYRPIVTFVKPGEDIQTRLDALYKKYGVTSEEDAYAQMEQLRAEKWDLENRMRYNLLNQNTNFGTESKPTNEHATAGFFKGDYTYDYINDLDNTRAKDMAAHTMNGGSKYSIYSLMNEDEIANYNFLYNTEGKASANKYLDYLEYTLNQRRMYETTQNAQMLAEDHPVFASVASVPANLLSGVGIIDIAGQKLYNSAYEAVTGKYAGPVDYKTGAMAFNTFSSTVRGTVASNLADKSGVIQMDGALGRIFNGKSLGDVYQLGMSMADSAAIAAMYPFVGGAGTFLLGGSAGTQGMLDAKARGATDGQAILMGILNGTAETLFEYWSIDKLMNGIASGKGFVTLMLSQGLAEGSEELNTTIANYIADAMVMAEKSEWRQNIAGYIANGLSPEDAEKQAFWDAVIQAGWDAAGGFLSGIVMGAGGSLVNAGINKVNTDINNWNQAKETYGAVQGELVEEALDIDPSNQYAWQMRNRIGKGKNLSGKQLYNLVQQNEAGIRSGDVARMADAIEGRLTQLGETGDVRSIASAIAKQAAGRKLTKAESGIIAKSRYGKEVANEVNPENVRSGEPSSAWVKGIGTERIHVEEYNQQEQEDVSKPFDGEAKAKFVPGRKDADAANPAIANLEEDLPDVNADGKTIRTDTGEDIEIDGFDTAGENGMLKTKGGKTVSLRNVSFASTDEAILYSTVAKVSPSANIANTLMKQFRGQSSISAIDYAAALMEAYDAGRIGDRSVRELGDAEFAGNLNYAQREAAYNQGKRMAYKDAYRRQQEAKKKSGGKKEGKLHFDRDGRKLDAMREGSLAVMDTLAKALGVDIYVYESYVNEAGKRVYLSERGEKKAPNGFYDPADGSIHIDLNAGQEGRGTMLFTVAHELTHFIKDWSSVKYRAMADALVKQYQKKGESVSNLVDNQLYKAEQNGRKISREEAFDEVVADSMESMLTDENAAAFLEKLAKRDKGLKEKIVSWLKELAGKLKNALTAYKDVKPDSPEGKMVAEMEEFRKEIMGIYTSALVDAGENFRSASEHDGYSSDKDVQFSDREDKKRITMSMTDSERTEILQEKVITAEVYEGQADNSIAVERDNLRSYRDNLVKAALTRIGKEFGVFTDYRISDVDVDIRLSKSNLKESISKKIDAVQIAKLLPVLESAIGNAVGIECHENRYFYDNNTVMFENLLGGYVDGDYFVPVRFGLKHQKSGSATLYLIVDQQKIEMEKVKAEVTKTPAHTKVRPNASRSAFHISLPSIIPFVNSKDLLRYIPDDMLNANQKTAKWEAIAETIQYTDDKNDRRYSEYIRNNKLPAANQMVQQAARTAGYTKRLYHGTAGEPFYIFRLGDEGIHFGTLAQATQRVDVARQRHQNTSQRYSKQEIRERIGDLSQGARRYIIEEVVNGSNALTDYEVSNGYNLSDGAGNISDEVILHYLDKSEIDTYRIPNSIMGINPNGRVIDAYVKAEHPVVFDADIGEWTAYNIAEALLHKIRGEKMEVYSFANHDWAEYDPSGISGIELTETDIPELERISNQRDFSAIAEFLQSKGIDSIQYLNTYEGKQNEDSYILLSPEQVKSADVITYDDDGSIIPISQRFNPDNPDYRFSDRDPTAEATRAALEKENGKLREDVSRLRELLSLQGKVTGGTVPKPSSVEAAAKYLNKYAGAKADVKELSKMLTDFYRFIATEKDYSWEDVQQRAMVIARYLQDNVQLKPQLSDYARDVIREVRSSNIMLDEYQWDAVEWQYGSYDDFRKAASGSATFVKEGGIWLDSKWQELSKMFPGTFDSKTASADRPQALLDSIAGLRNSDTTVMEYAYNRDSIAQDLAVAVYDSYWRVDALNPASDKNRSEINALRAKHNVQIQAVKKSREDTVQSIKNKRKDDISRIRSQYYKNRLDGQKAEYQESRKKAVDSRNRAKMREQVKKTVNELNHLLLDGDKKRHVPESMRKAVAEILSAVNMETSTAEARSAAFERTVARYNQRIKLENDPAERARLEAARDAYIGKGDQFKAKIDALAKAYEDIKNSSDPALQDAYSDAVSQYLFTLEARVGDTRLGDMTLDQLKTVQEVLNIVISTIRNANRSFLNARAGTIEQQASRSISEVSSAWGKKKEGESGVGRWLRGFHYRNLKPIYLMRAIGSNALTEAYNNLRRGEDTWYRDIQGGREFFLSQSGKYGYGKWDLEKTSTFSDDSGGEVKLTLGQIMSLYAYSKREAASEHLRLGGVVIEGEAVRVNKLGMKVTYHLNDATSHQLGPETLGKIIGTLTKEQRAFVDAMQDYLSTVMADKGNEVSLAMYGIKLFREKNYFPIQSAKQFVDQKNEPVGEVKLKNSGFTNKTVPKANNPMVLRDFMDVWADHVNEMSNYHAFVLAIEDFNRIINYQTAREEGTAPVSLKQTIQSYMGEEAVSAVRELIQSVNGGALVDPAATFVSKAINLFKKNAVFASASVVIQQPSAIVRAAALIDPRHFTGRIIDREKVSDTWEIIKKYAPVAGIKDMGYFDTNMGKSTVDYIKGPEHDGLKDVMTGIVKREKGSFDELLSMAPGYADKVTWCAIWEAVKRETAAKHPKLATRSEEFLKICGERFTEVITQTQVYDSVFARSGNMRSKDKLMGMATSFMAEPTTAINMIYDAVLQGTRGNKAYMRRAIGAVIGAAVLNAVLKSIVYAERDEDEDETYGEKYVSALASALKDDVLFLVPNSIPFVRDIMSLAQGYSVERTDMEIADDLVSAVKKLYSDNASSGEKILGILGSFGNLLFPAKNMIREVEALINVIDTFRDSESQTAMGIRNAIREGWSGETVSNARQLYEARMAGDTAHEERVAARYENEKSANSAVVSAIKEAFMDGDLSEEDAQKHLILYGNTDAGDAYWKVKEWIYAKDKGTTDGYGKYNDLYDAILNGGDIQGAVAEFTENGYDEDEVMSNVKKEVGRWFWDDESETRISAEQAAEILEKYFGMKQGEIQETILKWSMKKDTGISFDGLREAYLEQVVSESDVLTYLRKYGGMTEYDAQERVADWEFEAEHGYAYADIKATYLDDEITREEAIAVMTEIGGKSRDDAEQKVAYWDYEEKTGVDYENKSQQYKRGIITRQQLRQALIDLGEYSGADADIQIEVYDWEQSGLQGVSFSRVKNWHEYCEGVGVSKSMWLQIALFSANTENDVGSDGKKIMEKINSLNISKSQKDALALAIGEQENWSAKTIAKYKLW